MSRVQGHRRRAWLVAVAAVAALLTGCTPLTAIDQRALVLALAFDVGNCPGGIRATAQWYGSPPSLALRGSERAESQSACGDDVDNAVERLREHAKRYLDFGVTNLILIGSQLARQVQPTVDLVWREGELPETAQVMVVDGQAAEVLLDAQDENAFLLYTRSIDSQASNTAMTPMTLWRFEGRRWGLPGDAWAPVIAMAGSTVRSRGVALFDHGHLATILEGRPAAAFGWLTKIGGYSDVDLSGPHMPNASIGLRVLSRGLRRTCVGGLPVVDLTLRTRLRAGDTVRLRGRDDRGLQRIASEVAWQDVSTAIRSGLAAGSDPVGLRSMGCVAHSADALPTRLQLRVHVQIQPDEREA